MTPQTLRIWIVVPTVLFAIACGDGKYGGSGGGGGGDDDPGPGCEDQDGDGFGRGADCAGTDCDEGDAAVHAGCVDECATCQDACLGWDDCPPIDPAAGSDLLAVEGGGVTVTSDGTGEGPNLSVIWIANSAEGTVSKVDTRTRLELGRYYTGSNHLSDNPSRTSVDDRGDVVVGNRAFGIQATVTKVLAGECPDRNGNGVVETSTGRGDVLPWGTDECVAWSTNVGCADGGGGERDPEGQGDEGDWPDGGFMGCGVARSIAVQNRVGLDGVDAAVVWVGLYNEQKYVELDRTTGAATGVEVSVAPCTPYGAAIDRDGRLWSACLSQYLASFDTARPEAGANVLSQPGSNYGITVDEHGHVWTGGSVTRYDPATGEFRQPGVDGEAEPCDGDEADGQREECWWGQEGMAYGSAVAADGQGSVWVGGCGGGVCRIREDGDTLTMTSLPVGNGAYGMAVDFDGLVWGIGMGGNNAAVIDPDTETFELVLNDCEGGGGGNEWPDGAGGGMGGTGCLAMPYTYSDMTGFQMHNAQDPRGNLPLLFEGCAEGPTAWRVLVAEADVPQGTAISIDARAADTRDGLSGVAFVRVGSLTDGETELDLSALTGAVLELRITLQASRGAAPVLYGLRTAWSCEELFM